MDMSMQRGQVRHNFLVNLLDGTFFGLGLGFASWVTVIPLFFASLTESTVLIGLVATIHLMGWQLPQLFITGRMARLTRYKPMVLVMTLHERIPMFVLAGLALLVPFIPRELALMTAFAIITWQSLGAGLTANAWQSMVAKILPHTIRGTFYGLQSGSANLLASIAAFIAGSLLLLPYPLNFAVCFFLTGVAMMVSFVFLALTREVDHTPVQTQPSSFADNVAEWKALLRNDRNFMWFIVARALMQFGQIGAAFYTVHALRTYSVSPQLIGVMTGVMLLAQVVASPLLGYLGDRLGHRAMLIVGCAAMALGAGVAIFAPTAEWFFLVFILTGLVNSSQWTSTLAFTSEFGNASTRPYYVGLSNTLIVPATLIAPVMGGWIADVAGFNATFLTAIVGAGLAAFVVGVMVYNPKPKRDIDSARPLAQPIGD
jgi:MFS family permease